MQTNLHLLLITSQLVTACIAWVPSVQNTVKHQSLQTLYSSSPMDCDASNFEQWCRAQGSNWNSAVSHALFFDGRVRGLQWKGNTPLSQPECAVSIPSSIALSVEDNDQMWDAKLACKLWEEMKLGSRSSISGYCSWLSSVTGDVVYEPGSVPPSTVPDALRHWTDEEKAWLAIKPAGKALIELQKKQEAAWRIKYQQYSNFLSWEAFEWCMEVVHSRAFRGIGSSVSLVPASTAPLIAAAAGWYYVTAINPLATTSKGDDTTLALLAIVGILFASFPTILQLLQKPIVALLPLIDSANHLETADSKIEFDPSKKSFDLIIGPQCVDKDSSQLYISYGKQSDNALLLNHGFLPTVQGKEGDSASVRQRLAESYLARNL